MTAAGFPPINEQASNDPNYVRRIAEVANRINRGGLNVARDAVTLTASVATTTITDARISNQSFIGLMPLTSNAAAALATTYIPAATQINGSAVVAHANNAQTDRTFRVLIIG